MNRRWSIPLLALFIVLRGSIALACLNDTAVRAAEDEFRSRYERTSAKDAPAPERQSGANGFNPWGIAGLAVGSGMIGAASIFGFGWRRRGDA